MSDHQADTWFGEVRSILNGARDRGAWAALCAWLWSVRNERMDEVVLGYIEQHLERWPDALRRVPSMWMFLLSTEEVDADSWLWGLMRSVVIDGAHLEASVGHGLPESVHPHLFSSWMEGLTHLELDNMNLGNEDVHALISCFRGGHLQRLVLRGNLFDDQGVNALIDASMMQSVEELDLRENLWGGYEDAISNLATSPHVGRLKRLDIQCCLSHQDLMLVLGSQRLQGLEHLGLNSCLYSMDLLGTQDLAGVESLRDAEMRLRNLRSLDLTSNQIDDDRLMDLIDIEWVSQLTHLRLDWNEVTGYGLEKLATSESFTSLEALSLKGLELDESSARVLCHGNHLPHLKSLNLDSAEGLSDADAYATRPPRLLGVASSSHFWVDVLSDADMSVDLEYLNLSNLMLELSVKDVHRLGQSGRFKRLNHLVLANVAMSAEVLDVLCQGVEGFDALERLNLSFNHELGHAFGPLVHRTLSASLRWLSLQECGLDDEDILAMCALSEQGAWPWSGLKVLDLRGNVFGTQSCEALNGLIQRELCEVLFDYA